MNKNRIILAVLAASLLVGQPLVAQEQSQSSLVDRAKKEYKAFRKALKCAHQKGFHACSYEEKKRIIRDGAVLLAVMAVVTYGGFRGVRWWQEREAEQRAQERLKKETQEEWKQEEERAKKEKEEPNILLFDAAIEGDVEGVRTAISKGASVHAEGNFGLTPLHLAAAGGKKGVAEFLIKNGASLNAQDNKGFTPLHHAAYWDKKEVVELLINNAETLIDARSNEGKTPLYFARTPEIKKLLQKHGAR